MAKIVGLEPIWVFILAHAIGVQQYGCVELCSIALLGKFEIQGETTLGVLEEIGE